MPEQPPADPVNSIDVEEISDADVHLEEIYDREVPLVADSQTGDNSFYFAI